MAAVAGAFTSGWRDKNIAEWSNPEVREFLEASLPGHPCAAQLQHTSGRVLSSLTKDDLRSHVRDEEAANVIWAELKRLRAKHEERDFIEANGAHPFTVYIRTPADISIEIEVRPTDTVLDLKARVAAMEGTPVESQRLMRHGAPLLDARTLAACNVSHGTVLLLVPRLTVGSHRYAVPASGVRSAIGTGTASEQHRAALGGMPPPRSGIPRPRVPVVCADVARPFPMCLEFEGVPEYQSFMLALQREVGRRDSSSAAATAASPRGGDGAPFLEVLPADNLHDPVQTRIVYDVGEEVLQLDTLGDIVLECARYRVLLHLRSDQKTAELVTGIRPHR